MLSEWDTCPLREATARVAQLRQLHTHLRQTLRNEPSAANAHITLLDADSALMMCSFAELVLSYSKYWGAHANEWLRASLLPLTTPRGSMRALDVAELQRLLSTCTDRRFAELYPLLLAPFLNLLSAWQHTEV